MWRKNARLLSCACLFACSGASPSDLISSLATGPGNASNDSDRRPDGAALPEQGRPPTDASALEARASTEGGPSDSTPLSDASALPSAEAAAAGPGKGGFVQIAAATPQSFVPCATAMFVDAQRAGDLNVVAIGWSDSTADVADVSDTAGNGYRLAVGPTRTGGASQSIYYASGIAASPAGNSVHVRFARDVPRADLRVVEYSGLDRAMPLDGVAAMSGGGTMATSGAATTAESIELVFGAGTSTDAFSDAGALFALRIVTADGNIVEDRIVASPGTYSADAVLPDSVDWVMQLATFR